MSSIGATLKDARAKQALTFEDVHAKIKIHPRVLQLLEEEKFDRLPSPLFAKSFLRSYADFLSIDTDQILQQYERLDKKDPEQVLFIKPAEMREKPMPDMRWLMTPLLLAAVAGGAYGVWIAGKLINQSIPAWKLPAVERKAAAPKKEKAKAVPAPKKPTDWLRSAAEGNFPSIPKGTPLSLKVKAVDNVWMRVTCDGKILFQSILKRGTAQTWTANQSVEIWTGNSSNMVLALNGTSLGSPGKGVIKKLTITHEGVRAPQ